jgi:hypothetical protein
MPDRGENEDNYCTVWQSQLYVAPTTLTFFTIKTFQLANVFIASLPAFADIAG